VTVAATPDADVNKTSPQAAADAAKGGKAPLAVAKK